LCQIIYRSSEFVGLFEGQVSEDIQSQLDTQLATLSPEQATALQDSIAQYAAQRAEFASNGKSTVDMQQMIEQVQKQAVPMTYSATAQVSDLVDTRIDTIDTADKLASNQGIAAGDMGHDFKHGIWIKGNISKDNYKAIAGQKYKARTIGAVLGYDVKFNENIMAGLAFGYQQSAISSALKLRSLVGMAYGQYNFDMPIFVGAKYSYAASIFSGKEKVAGIDLLALGLNNFHTLSTDVGYNHSLATNAQVTPTAGLKYIAHNWNLPKKWTSNVTPKAKNGSAAYATLGIKLKGLVEHESYNFIPYISTEYATRIAHRKTKLTLTNKRTGASVVFPIDVAEKTKFTASTGVTTKINEIFSASLGYKYTKTKLYYSHGGALGLRFDF